MWSWKDLYNLGVDPDQGQIQGFVLLFTFFNILRLGVLGQSTHLPNSRGRGGPVPRVRLREVKSSSDKSDTEAFSVSGSHYTCSSEL